MMDHHGAGSDAAQDIQAASRPVADFARVCMLVSLARAGCRAR